MNTDLTQHKSVLFLISLSENKIHEIEEKGVDYKLFLKTIRGYANVELHETITEELIGTASEYKVVVIVGHQVDGCIEMTDGTLFPLLNIATALPSSFNGYLHIAVCGSAAILDAVKQRCPDSRVRASNNTTQLELHLLIYSLLLSYNDLNKQNFDNLFEYYKTQIKEIQERKDPADLAKLPIATKLGEEPDKDIKTSVYAPDYVTRGEYYKLQVLLHYDADSKTLLIKAQGKDPKAASKEGNITLENIHSGDTISLCLGFKDAKRQFTELISIEETLKKEDSYYVKDVVVNGDKTVTFHVMVDNEYTHLSFSTILSIKKDGDSIMEPIDFLTYVKSKEPQIPNIHSSQGKQSLVGSPIAAEGPKEETEQERYCLSKEDEEILKRLTEEIFFNKEKEARELIIFCRKVKKPVRITNKVNELHRKRIIHRDYLHRPLYKILKEGKLYNSSESNWNRRIIERKD